MSTGPDFDALTATAKASGDVRDLWRAWFSLDAHWLLPSPGGNGSPFIGQVDGAGWVFLFTDAQQARAAGLRILGLPPESDVNVLRVPMPGAIDWLVSLGAYGVAGVRVNEGDNGFFAPLSNLVPMREYYAAEGRPPA